MKNDIQTPPRTAMEVFKMLPEGTLCEVINGQLFMSPSPFTQHQMIITELLSALHILLKSKKMGHVFTAPYDVYLDEYANAVQPDIIVVLKENENIIKDHIHGVPDIIIEVLSQGNKNHDLIKKRELYEQFGVKEYFIIEPDTKLVRSFKLLSGKYISETEQTARLTSTLLANSFEF
jgi:Uma2 family endonuclease